MIEKMKRFTAFFLVLALVLGNCRSTIVTQARGKERTYKGEEYKIVLTEQSNWKKGYIAQAAITNTGTKSIANWEIHTGINTGRIEDAWNVTAEESDGGYMLSCQSYNKKIAVGETVTFGYRSTGAGIGNIVSMELKQKKKGTIHSEDFSISYHIASQWSDSANVEVTIHNNTNRTIHNWELKVQLEAVINSIWGAALLQQENGVCIMDGSNGAADIEEGGEVTFGMSLTLAGGAGFCPANEQLSCTDGVLIKEKDGVETAATTEQSTIKDTEKEAGSTTESSSSGEGSFTEEQEVTENVDTGWDDTMIHADAEVVKQYGEKAQGRVKVAMLDSGVDYWNDINVVERANFVSDCEDSNLLFDDLSGHGTAAAALLAADAQKWNGETQENPVEEEEDTGTEYDGLTEEDMDNIDFSVVQSLTAETIAPKVDGKTKNSYQEMKQILETLVQQQAESEYEEETGETPEESAVPSQEVTAETEGLGEAIAQEDTPEELDTAEEGEPKPEGMEAFANLFNGESKTVQGVNPNVDIYSARVLDTSNEASITSAVAAMEWAIEQGVQVVQIGFGVDKDSESLHRVIQKAYKKGILIVAPAGNGETVQYPAKYEEVIAVGSVTCEGKRSSQSASGEAMELVAPGELVCSRGAFGILEQYSGTSMAVPQVVGLATLLWQRDLSQPADCIRKLMDATANALGEQPLYGYGLIDCQEAMEQYDDFVAWYGEQNGQSSSGDAAKAQEELGENEQPVQVVDEEIVKGCWNKDGHIKTVDYKGINAIKYGAIWSDKKESKIAGMTSNPAFHGYYQKYNKDGTKTSCNYIEGYFCLVKAAQHFKEYGTLTNYTYKVPKGSDGLCGMVGKLKKQWMTDKIIKQFGMKKTDGSYDETNRTKGAYFLYGMALHTLADIFAHSAYGYNSYTYQNNSKGMRLTGEYSWSAIRHGSCVIKDKKYYLSNQSDNRKYKPQRYQQAQVVVKTALNSIGTGNDVLFDNGISGSIMVFTDMTEKISLREADKNVNYDANGNVSSGDKRNQYIKKQFALKKFCTYLKQSYNREQMPKLIQKICKEAQLAANLKDEEIIQRNWQVFDNGYVQKKIESWSKLNFKVKSLKYSSKIQKFKVIDVTQSKANIAANKKNKGLKGYQRKKEIVAISLKKNTMPLTMGHTYLIVLKGTKVTKNTIKKSVKKADTASLSKQSVDSKAEGREESYAAVKLFTVGEGGLSQEFSSEECALVGTTVDVELLDSDMVTATVEGGVVEMEDAPDHVGKALGNRKVCLYEWDADFSRKVYDTYEDEEELVPIYETTTDSNGYYSFLGVIPGKYILYLEDEEYMMYKTDITVKTGTAQVHNELARLVKWEYKGKSEVHGTIRDALDRTGVEGLELRVQTAGRVLRAKTDAKGQYIVKGIFAGCYQTDVVDTKGRYAKTSFTMVVDGRKDYNAGQDAVVSKKLPEGQMRIVATWGAENKNYDGHVAIKDENNPLFYVDLYHNYVEENYELFQKDGNNVAGVYSDFSSGAAPESFMIYDSSMDFDYHLYNFNFEEKDGMKEFKKELVKIEVYQGTKDRAVQTYYVPYQDGYWWNAFHYDSRTNTFRQMHKMTKYPGFEEDGRTGTNPWRNGWERVTKESLE